MGSVAPRYVEMSGVTPVRKRRTVQLYVLAIVLPSLVLLYLSWRMVDSQHEAIVALTAANRALATTGAAAAIESRVSALAHECLRDPTLTSLQAVVLGSLTLPSMDESRRLAATVVARHPIASAVFVADDAAVRFPPLDGPLSLADGFEAQPGQAPSSADAEYRRLFAAAERLEIAASQPAAAEALYRRCVMMAVDARRRAIARSRVARCLARSGRHAEARAVWQQVARSDGDHRDLANQPFGLVAALALAALPGNPASNEPVGLAYDDLLRGRWSLGVNQAEYFAGRLESALGRTTHERWASAYLQGLRLAQLVEAGGVRQRAAADGGLGSALLARDPATLVIFGRATANAPVVGLRLDVPWAARHLVDPATRALGPATMTLMGDGVPGAETADTVRTPFTGLLTGFELRLGPVGTATSPGWQAWAFGGTTILTLSALGLGILLLVRDTARERETNRMRADLVSGVSHELKTPLTLIRVCAETLDTEPAPESPDRHTFCSLITREADRLTSLIDRVLSFSRVDRGERTYHMVAGRLDDVVREVLGQYRGYLLSRGFVVRECIAPALPPVAHDGDAIAEALLNLLENATKYSADVKEIEVSLTTVAGGVALEVRDRGIGIAPAEQEHVFQRFYRSPVATGRGGYGLGLFLVRHITEAHGGRVELESAPGAGSRFRLILPAAPPVQES